MKKLFLIPLLTLSIQAAALAQEQRLERDKNVSLKDGEIRVSDPVQQHGIFRAEGHAVFVGSFDKMVAASEDYDRYVEMKMPYIEKSFVAERSAPDLFYVFNQAMISGIRTRHYMEVRTYRKLNAEGSAGHTWQLTPQRPRWPESEAPSFTQLDGSVYFEVIPASPPPGKQRVYVRYFMAVNPEVPLMPDWAIADLVNRHLSQGVRQVLENLGKAGMKSLDLEDLTTEIDY